MRRAFELGRRLWPDYAGPFSRRDFTQPQLFASGDPHGVLLNIAKSAGMTEAQFNACVQDEAALKALSDRVQRAEDVDHISGTPTLLVNGKPLGVGEVTMAQLDGAIQPLLAK